MADVLIKDTDKIDGPIPRDLAPGESISVGPMDKAFVYVKGAINGLKNAKEQLTTSGAARAEEVEVITEVIGKLNNLLTEWDQEIKRWK